MFLNGRLLPPISTHPLYEPELIRAGCQLTPMAWAQNISTEHEDKLDLRVKVLIHEEAKVCPYALRTQDFIPIKQFLKDVDARK